MADPNKEENLRISYILLLIDPGLDYEEQFVHKIRVIWAATAFAKADLEEAECRNKSIQLENISEVFRTE